MKKNGRQPKKNKKKWKTKINLIYCDTIVNSPSLAINNGINWITSLLNNDDKCPKCLLNSKRFEWIIFTQDKPWFL